MDIIHYDELTWPEIADLPRRMPLLIPLGLQPYPPSAVARSLRTDEFGFLPAIPYGFPEAEGDGGRGLGVGRGLFRRVLRGVAAGLSRQGFERVYFLDGHGLRRRWDLNGIGLLPIRLPGPASAGLPWPADLHERVVILSLGHTEQHGLHLPLSTDTLIIEAITRGIADRTPDRVFCLPVWPFGVSTHTDEFPGTLNLGGRVFEDFFLAIVGRLVKLGARMIFFSNGHGGNHSFLVNVVKLAGERSPGVFVATEWLHTTGSSLARLRQSPLGGMGHGGELETSYVLHLRPNLVHMDRATIEMEFISTSEYGMDWVESGRMIANPPWSDDTTSGIYGDATVATGEKGRLWLAAAVGEKVGLLDEIRQQAQRRAARRASRAAPHPS
ncbi:MAG TPA: creatininase family protein [Anaerolineales bacterium]|nr:creatininase family protein [Anaerolineales bacterium]